MLSGQFFCKHQRRCTLKKKKDHLTKFFGILTITAGIIAAIPYCYYIWIGDVQPATATWIVAVITVSLSYSTYWSTDDISRSFMSNAGNLVDLLVVWMILISIIVQNGLHITLSVFDILCLSCSASILLWWWRTRAAKLSNLLIQVVMVIAYFPTYHKLWESETNTELFFMWIVSWFAGIFALLSGRFHRDGLAMTYALRAILSVSLVLYLMIRIELR